MQINMIPASKSNYTAGRTSTIKYIVMHYTANNGDTAKNNANYFAGANRNASAHYFVDENEVWRSVNDNDTAWHCGAKRYYHDSCRNNNSISIEICSYINNQGEYALKEKAVSLAAQLAILLMKTYNIPINNVLRHYDVTHKICPQPWVNDEAQWSTFKSKLNVANDVEKSKVIVNGKDIILDRIFKEGTNYVNVRQLMTSLGYTVSHKDTIAIFNK